MCLPNFIEFKQIDKNETLTGYRNWKNLIKNNSLILKKDNSLILKSESRKYNWSSIEGPHEVKEENSGIYAYNNYYYNYYYYYNNYYNNNYYNNNYYYYNNYNYNYYLSGIIKQYGKIAIHKNGYRSEYAYIDTLFNIRESDARGLEKFISWIKLFNNHINEIAKKYKCKVISWQDFKDSNK